ncbi:hypothetical protein [Streptomyces sp. 142MFCol3.1]|uniref:hypothetical protein n=1 Tax=Streptomyces sp. 142MFCol3.1 TaxID=1172179 RepID=UPI00040D75C9|nr:hypothetical protein [Streptomyces sp. 142MFCol3.1]
MSLQQDRTPDPAPGGDPGDAGAHPSEQEHAAWSRVRRTATGMGHHAAKNALVAARKAAEDDSLIGQDAFLARAVAEEWERIAETLADHAGTYDPADDPFVQGELAARAHQEETAVHDH